MAGKKRREKAPPRKQEKKVEEEKKGKKQSVRVKIAGVAVTLRQSLTLLDDAIGHLDEADLDDARYTTMRAMDIVADERISDQLDECVAEIQNKMDTIEELEAGLL